MVVVVLSGGGQRSANRHHTVKLGRFVGFFRDLAVRLPWQYQVCRDGRDHASIAPLFGSEIETMLHKISETPDSTDEETSLENSESRMLRALEAMSTTSVRPGGADPGTVRRPGPPRDIFRAEGGAQHGNKPRHRFVRDGEVPVVHMAKTAPKAPMREAVSSVRTDSEIIRLQTEVETWKQRAEQADRAYKEMTSQTSNQLKNLHTQLGHIELARADAQALADSRAEEILSLQAEIARLRTAQTRPAPRPAAPPVTSGEPDTIPVKRGRGRPRKYPLPTSVAVIEPEQTKTEPEPVAWWLLPPAPPRKRR